jgi:hypothetical protein
MKYALHSVRLNIDNVTEIGAVIDINVVNNIDDSIVIDDFTNIGNVAVNVMS